MFQKLKQVFLIQDFVFVMVNSLTEALAKAHKNEQRTITLHSVIRNEIEQTSELYWLRHDGWLTSVAIYVALVIYNVERE